MRLTLGLSAALVALSLSMTGLVCLGSYLDGSGGCPARMPWEMNR